MRFTTAFGGAGGGANGYSIKLAVGARIFTIKFSKVNDDTPPYFSTNRKYMCQVRPVMSNISDDKDLNILESIRKGL